MQSFRYIPKHSGKTESNPNANSNATTASQNVPKSAAQNVPAIPSQTVPPVKPQMPTTSETVGKKVDEVKPSDTAKVVKSPSSENVTTLPQTPTLENAGKIAKPTSKPKVEKNLNPVENTNSTSKPKVEKNLNPVENANKDVSSVNVENRAKPSDDLKPSPKIDESHNKPVDSQPVSEATRPEAMDTSDIESDPDESTVFNVASKAQTVGKMDESTPLVDKPKNRHITDTSDVKRDEVVSPSKNLPNPKSKSTNGNKTLNGGKNHVSSKINKPGKSVNAANLKALPLRDFLKFLKSVSGIGKTTVEDFGKVARTVESGVSSVDTMLKDVAITKDVNGFIKMGEETMGSANKIMREGNLAKIVKMGGKDIPYTSVEVAAYGKLVKDTPEKLISSLEEAVTANKRKFPHLDVSSDKLDTLSSTAKKDVKKVESNLMKKLKSGAVVGLTIGTVVVGVDWVIKATKDRKGCFMQTVINGKMTSCKVTDFSCLDATNANACSTDVSAFYNTTLLLMHASQMEDTSQFKIDVAKAISVTPADFTNDFATILVNHYETLATFLASYAAKPKISICTLKNDKVEKGIIPTCRMCDPSADPTSTRYIDPSQYPENVTFKCVEDPSILDTITDAAKSTGLDLLDGLTGWIGNLAKMFAIVVVIILVLVLAINIFTRFRVNRNNTT